jgi:hypothetical protein
MKNMIIFLLVMGTANVFAKEQEHREHEAHVHGAAALSIAFEGSSGRVEFKGASDGILGFEYEAKSTKDKETLAKIIAQFESNISKMIQLDSSLGCLFVKDKIEQHREGTGSHSDFIANFNVVCQKSIKGSKLNLNFTSFKGLKDLDVTILADELQKSVELKDKPVTVDLAL